MATANHINQSSVIKLTKQSAGTNQALTTTLVAESQNGNDVSEIAGEPVWKISGYFGQLRTDYNLEKANFPQNALLYLNQAYLTVQKSKKYFMGSIFYWGRSMSLPILLLTFRVRSVKRTRSNIIVPSIIEIQANF